MKMKAFLTLAALAVGTVTFDAPAQDTPDAQPGEGWAVTWSDPAFGEIAGMLTGTWKTTTPVAEFADASQQAEVVMSISPARLTELPDALYVETARADSVERPYRSAFLQFYRRQGEIRLRTLEVRGPGNPVLNMLVGLWAAPEFIPDVPRDDLIATLDLQFVKSGDAWVGETPYPYPTAVGGAVEMTSRMRVAGGRVETADRGYGADGAVLWGPGKGESYVFERTDPHFGVDRQSSGVTVITIRENAETDPYSDGDRIAFQYSGWLTNGRMFDSSRRANKNPLSYTAPGNLIVGWSIGTAGMSEGDWRKFIVPPSLGYGSNSAAGGAIPPDSILVFEAECVSMQKGAPMPAVVPAPGG